MSVADKQRIDIGRPDIFHPKFGLVYYEFMVSRIDQDVYYTFFG